LNTKTKGLQWNCLAEQFFGFGGDGSRPSQQSMLFQPIFNKILRQGKFIQFGPIMNFNWTNITYNIPLALTFGDLKYVKFGETYFQPIQENGKNMYEVVDVEEDK
jgi:hypothetical protein